MATYLSPDTIRSLREERRLTQRALADALGVTDKAVSKWESGRGLPDISLVADLARELGVSVTELLTGDVRTNANRSGNLLRSAFYVCPLCGNVVHALGEGSFSCCGVPLLPQEAEEAGGDHGFRVEPIEDEWFVSLDHPMTKGHYASFVAYVTTDAVSLQKLYPEQDVAVRFRRRGSGFVYLFCNRHGLFRTRVGGRPQRA